MIAIRLAAALLIAPVVLAAVYQLMLALVHFAPSSRRPRAIVEASRRFAILIPAHDEEATLPAALRSCAGLDYPTELVDVVVIADNCSDRTAEVAGLAGVRVLRRSDERRGKGHALEWALGPILREGYEAIVVLDADCRLDSWALRTFDRLLADGEQVLQASYVASNPDAGAMSYALAVANRVENELFYEPKSRLGLAVFLRGTGMAFRADILRRFPWRARTIVEDAEYTLDLLRGGVRIRFVAEVCVVSEFPERRDQLAVQRTRWTAGGVALARAQALRLIAEGVARRRPVLVDAGGTLLIASRPLMLGYGLVAIAIGIGTAWAAPGSASMALLAASVAALAIQAACFGLGVLGLGLSRSRLRLLAGTPAAVARSCWIAGNALGRGVGADWARTPRAAEQR